MGSLAARPEHPLLRAARPQSAGQATGWTWRPQSPSCEKLQAGPGVEKGSLKRLLVGPLLGCLAVGLVLVLRPAPPALPGARVLALPQPYQMPRQRVSLFDRCIPAKPAWAWLWRLKQAIVGQPKQVNLNASIIEFPNAPEAILARLAPSQVSFLGTNGVRVWVLEERELNAVRRQITQTPGSEVLYAPRVATADEIIASMFSGQTLTLNSGVRTVGLDIALLARVRGDTTDLTAIFTLSQTVTNPPGISSALAGAGLVSVETNLDVGVRLQIPNRGGAFLLKDNPSATSPRSIGVVLSASLPPRKK